MEASDVEHKISKAIEAIYLQAIMFDCLSYECLFGLDDNVKHYIHVLPYHSGNRLCFDENKSIMGVYAPDGSQANLNPYVENFFHSDVTKKMFGFSLVSYCQYYHTNNGAHIIEWKLKLHPETVVGPRLAEKLLKTHEIFLTFSNRYKPRLKLHDGSAWTLNFDEAVARPKFQELGNSESTQLLKHLEDALKEIAQLKTMCGLHGHFGPIHDYVKNAIPTVYDTGMFKRASDQ